MAEKNRSIVLRPQAQKNLDTLQKTSPRIFDELLKKIELLKEYPYLGPAMDRAYQGYRQVLCENFRIIYEIKSEQKIEIAYIRHCSRQLGLRLLDA